MAGAKEGLSESKRRCEGMSGDRFPQRCHEKANQEVEGRWYCGRHAAGRRKTLAHREQVDRELTERDARYRDLQARVTVLAEQLGTEVRLEYNALGTGMGDWTGKAVVTLEFLEALLAPPPPAEVEP